MSHEINPALAQQMASPVSDGTDQLVSNLMDFSEVGADPLRLENALPRKGETSQAASETDAPSVDAHTPPDSVFDTHQEQVLGQSRLQASIEDDSQLIRRRQDDRQERYDTESRGALSESDYSVFLDGLASSGGLTEATRRAALMQKEQQLQLRLAEARVTMQEVNEKLNELQEKESLQESLKRSKEQATQKQADFQNAPKPVEKPVVSAEAVLRHDADLDRIMAKVEQETTRPPRKQILPIISPDGGVKEQLTAEIEREERPVSRPTDVKLATQPSPVVKLDDSDPEAGRVAILQSQYAAAQAQRQEATQKGVSLENELIDVKSALQNIES
ncbi:MAG: hypothetical protein O3A01_03695 [bacterium]|nr:hypothetical protein [bacterium]